MKLTTTLNALSLHGFCATSQKALRKHLGKEFNPEAEVNLLTILEVNGVADMLSAMRATKQECQDTAARLACDFAELALPYLADASSGREVIQATRLYLDGGISLPALVRQYRKYARRDMNGPVYAAYAAAVSSSAETTCAYALGASTAHLACFSCFDEAEKLQAEAIRNRLER